MREAAGRALAEFGKVHVLCNNAGVSRAGAIETIASSDWDWVIGVNLKGLVHGLQLFLPQMKAHGEEGHIVNTASVNGVVGSPLAGPYSATKFAVVGISEVLAAELKDTPIGVSVLCPSWVKTRMLDNGRNRPHAMAVRSGSRPTAPMPSATRAMPGRWRPGSIRLKSRSSCCQRSRRAGCSCSRTRTRAPRSNIVTS